VAQQLGLGESLDHTERDARAANPAAGQRQCRESKIVGCLVSFLALFLLISGFPAVDVRKTARPQCFKFFA
jgi:hypothetical protein